MEPLSILSATGTIISITTNIVNLLSTLISQISGVDRSIQQLHREIQDLKLLLERMRHFWRRSNEEHCSRGVNRVCWAILDRCSKLHREVPGAASWTRVNPLSSRWPKWKRVEPAYQSCEAKFQLCWYYILKRRDQRLQSDFAAFASDDCRVSFRRIPRLKRF